MLDLNSFTPYNNYINSTYFSRRIFIVLPNVSVGDYLTNKPTQRVQQKIHLRECFFME